MNEQNPIRAPRLARCAAAAALLALSGCTWVSSTSTSTERHFPVGASSGASETAWRVSWTFEPHPAKPSEEIWVITGVDFMRGRKTVDGVEQPDWIRVLDRLAVAGMFVPYVEGGQRYRDFYGYYTGLAELDQSAVTRRAYRPTVLHGKRVVRETTDDFVRWMEVGPGGYHATARLRRGQAMTLWGMFSAYNYVYPVAFKFRDDGVIQVRIAASGQNLYDAPSKSRSHLHMGAWRLEPHLCAEGNSGCQAEDVLVEKVSRRPVGTQEEIVLEPFGGGSEGGDDWLSNEFTALLMTNPSQPNGRPIECASGQTPPCTSALPIGYALVPIRHGRARYKAGSWEGFLDHELWVTRKPQPPALAEIFYAEIDSYANGQTLAAHPKVVWIKSAYNHIPRYEDLGFAPGEGFDANAGVALTTFTGFDLVPRNLFWKTPLYTP